MTAFAGILGHTSQLSRLDEAVHRDRLHHAYLFTGRPGLGKHTIARRLARAGVCEGEGAVPCGRCRGCELAASDTHPDILTVEPAADALVRRITVDQVRAVIRAAAYHRYRAPRRFVLVSPADAMATEGANALLKVLEEPLAGTHFVLITSQPRVLLPTILSRCQRVRFAAVPVEIIERWLVDRALPDAIDASRLSLGSPGRALALASGGLEQHLRTRAELLEVLGSGLVQMTAWTKKLTSGKRSEWSERVDHLLATLEELLRDAAIVGSGSDVGLLYPNQRAVAERWAEALWPGGITTCQDALRETRRALGLNANGQLVVDALLARLATELGRARIHP